jgi:thioredoxin reductase
VPISTSSTIIEARGHKEVEEVVIAHLNNKGEAIKGTEQILPADCICIAAGLRPSTRLSQMAGCFLVFSPVLGGYLPVHNKSMETSVPDFYVAGDAAGVEEANAAMEEGRLAGIDMAEKLGYISRQEADNREDAVRQSLCILRSGPFGHKRHLAKLDIITKSRQLSSV